ERAPKARPACRPSGWTRCRQGKAPLAAIENGGAVKAIVQDQYGAPEQVLRLDELVPPQVGDGDVRSGALAASTFAELATAPASQLVKNRPGSRSERRRHPSSRVSLPASR